MNQGKGDGKEGKPTVLVLMSTYNGEKFLVEQLESIFAQEGCIVRLLIRDDGSTDSTREILNQFFRENEASVNRKSILDVIEGDNLGAARSFFQLLNMAADTECCYFALADQDDIWMPDKLAMAVAWLQKEENGNKSAMPLLYASAVQPVDEDKKILHAGIHYRHIAPSFGNALVENICSGCTCVMNRELLMLLKGRIPDFTVMHDFWIYLLASAFGKVVYDRQPHILYRQHKSNSIGMAPTLFGNYIRRIRNFRKHRGQLKHQAGEFEALYGQQLKMQSREKAELLKEFREGSRKLLFEKKLYRQRGSDNLIMKLFLLLGCL